MNRMVTFLSWIFLTLPLAAQQPVTLELDHSEGLLISYPTGYAQADYTFGIFPGGTQGNGRGIVITLQAGKGLVIYGPQVQTGPGDVLIECTVWTDRANVAMAVAGLNAPIDGSLTANMPANGADFMGSWGILKVITDPQNDALVPLFQVVSTGDPEAHVYIDRIVVTPIRSLESSQILDLFGKPAPTPPPATDLKVTIPGLPGDAKALEMVYIPAGTFLMGSPEGETDRQADESPQHEVTIANPFYIGKYEITQGQWQTLMGSNPSRQYGVGNNYPVYYISWNESQEFIAKLNALGQGTFRLPTEAEWEYVCRSGSTSPYYWGTESALSHIGKYAWYWWNAGNRTHLVGEKLPNNWGVYDLSGNVFEWCWDWYSGYSSAPATNPFGPAAGTLKVNRGGSWNSNPRMLRSAFRGAAGADERSVFVGLRVVKVIP